VEPVAPQVAVRVAAVPVALQAVARVVVVQVAVATAVAAQVGKLQSIRVLSNA
jgi:hypothetical protein